MKITSQKLNQIIKEEIDKIQEVSSTLDDKMLKLQQSVDKKQSALLLYQWVKQNAVSFKEFAALLEYVK